MILNAELIRLLQGMAGGEAPASNRTGSADPLNLKISPGTELRAQVIGQQSNGQSIVRIAGQLLSMELPASCKVGDAISLTYLGSDPKPTFLLSRQSISAYPASLSDVGRLLAQITQGQTPRSAAASPEQLLRPGRLLDAPPLDTAALADRLRNVLSKSGLFYESHLAQWSKGTRPLSELLQEPQARLSRPELLARFSGAREQQNAPRNLPQAPAEQPGSRPATASQPSATATLEALVLRDSRPGVAPTRTGAVSPQQPENATTLPGESSPAKLSGSSSTRDDAATVASSESPLGEPEETAVAGAPGRELAAGAKARSGSVPDQRAAANAPDQPAIHPRPDPATLRIREVYQQKVPEPAGRTSPSPEDAGGMLRNSLPGGTETPSLLHLPDKAQVITKQPSLLQQPPDQPVPQGTKSTPAQTAGVEVRTATADDRSGTPLIAPQSNEFTEPRTPSLIRGQTTVATQPGERSPTVAERSGSSNTEGDSTVTSSAPPPGEPEEAAGAGTTGRELAAGAKSRSGSVPDQRDAANAPDQAAHPQPDPASLRIKEAYQQVPELKGRPPLAEDAGGGLQNPLPGGTDTAPLPDKTPVTTKQQTLRQQPPDQPLPQGAGSNPVSGGEVRTQPADDRARTHLTTPQGNELADPQTFPLIREQLSALNTGQLVWQGEAWPGQQLKWEVEERDARTRDDEGETNDWNTSLRLTLPNLGVVKADLQIRGSRVRVNLEAAKSATITLLETESPRLAEALGRMGIQLEDMVITHGETEST